MRIILALLFVLGTLPAVAQEITCLDKLLPNSRYSGLHHLNKEDWSDRSPVFNPEVVKLAFKALTEVKLLCKSGEIFMTIDPVCQPLLADVPESHNCFLSTNLGHFFVSRDAGKNINFIFNKDKR